MEQLIRKFYSAFQNKDWKTMQECYHDEISFNDPVFQNLKGKEAKAMWHMLTSSAKDLVIRFDNIKTDSSSGSCHWEADYPFSRTGRQVHNVIDAKFEFKDEKIFRHDDYFDLWRWSRMALGTSGTLLGWSPIVRNKIRSLAKENLKKFMAANGY
ncbi:MAG: nuclear transport factor 2 family protein [Cyclobacteriaceae bacterium]